MKRILSVISVFAIFLMSCEGPQGPQGLDGFNGQNGAIIASSAFEIVLDLNQTNNYEYIEAYGFDVFPTDVTLVYILWETLNGQDIWRLMPQTVQFDDGDLIYNYDFTQTDVRFFLDGTTDFSLLDNSYTQNQVFRVVVVPADNVGKTTNTNLEAVMALYDIKTFTKR
ncbi:hypothetical protein [Lacinutrix sp. Bg11-31]|uniref:hypothetical protein n=1 Tax=Lacinutrix sp. Bg11-31 TaxID=2057808 RepID=UPI000C311B56|nr:hypothetical protein [Lacinutrix sp. Bg11-31]AUC81250.1 hypothetical protein CW733_03510 [Lacinutrix sp. Bg11-31]